MSTQPNNDIHPTRQTIQYNLTCVAMLPNNVNRLLMLLLLMDSFGIIVSAAAPASCFVPFLLPQQQQQQQQQRRKQPQLHHPSSYPSSGSFSKLFLSSSSYDPERESKLENSATSTTASSSSLNQIKETFLNTPDEEERMRLLQQHYDSMIPVRFINYDQIGGSTKLAYAVPGTNLLKIADELGIRIPRQCRTGLCGSCTADVKDPTWEGEEGERVGYQTIRTCRSGAMLPSGCDEMIIDCYRMVETAKIDEFGNVIQGNPLDFGDGWEEEYVPNYRGGSVVIKKKMKPEWTVKGGRMQSVDIRSPGFKPRLDDGVAPWDQIY